jgi:DNA-binding NtrC family response regulator
MRILIVDDEQGIRTGLKKILGLDGHDISESSNAGDAIEILKQDPPDCILLDLKLKKSSGLDVLDFAVENSPESSVIVMTGHGDVRNAVLCMKRGADNYLLKPIDKDLLGSILKKEEQIRQSRLERESLKAQLDEYKNRELSEFSSTNPEVSGLLDILNKVKDTDVPVLITGESGTGKEVTATYLHRRSTRSSEPFISVNCAALNDNLLETELFGHVKGAFTGAESSKPGRFELAGKGTLFLDEIGDMSLKMQAKLLRVIQEGVYEPVGGISSLKSECRLIAATNKSLKKLIAAGEFREDLYYRINVVELRLPPLRERVGDIPHLSRLFIQQANENFGREITSLAPMVEKQLLTHHWPGNIRQLKNVITNAVILSDSECIERLDSIPSESPCEDAKEPLYFDQDLKTTLANLVSSHEPEILKQALNESDWNISRSADKLGISRKTLYQKLKHYGIPVS